MRRFHKHPERGSAIVEFALISPWFLLALSALFTVGFATSGLTSVENAARIAAMHNAANASTAVDRAGACAIALEELRGMPGIGAGSPDSCDADPLTVTALYCDQLSPCSDRNVDGAGPAAFVRITYRTPPLFRVPLTNWRNITRTVEMRLRDSLP